MKKAIVFALCCLMLTGCVKSEKTETTKTVLSQADADNVSSENSSSDKITSSYEINKILSDNMTQLGFFQMSMEEKTVRVLVWKNKYVATLKAFLN